ncbi:Tctex-1 [Limtongia smithiae]|uniref:Tctex-1 n=1 Tax=Limtongia smithiae TaxID=1125753 RepID=UPI0034CE556B
MTVLRLPDATTLAANSPVPHDKLTSMCAKAIDDVITPNETFDNAKMSNWNEQIIHSILESLVSACSTHKFVIYCTVIEREGDDNLRQLRSTSGAYWNNETDGQWSYNWVGGRNGTSMDVVVNIVWISKE